MSEAIGHEDERRRAPSLSVAAHEDDLAGERVTDEQATSAQWSASEAERDLVVVALDESSYDSRWSAGDPTHGCIVDKINKFKATLMDTTNTVDERRFALRFLKHYIEEMHKPMPVGDNHDRGRNDTQVRFIDRGTNMHRLRHSVMIKGLSTSEASWLKDLATLEEDKAGEVAENGRLRIGKQNRSGAQSL